MKKGLQIKLEDISLDTIILWILQNKDDSEAMDRLNYLSYGFSSKFKQRKQSYNPNNDLEDGISIGL